MLKTRGELYLALEPIGLDARTHIRRQHLNHNFSIQLNLAGDKDPAHPRARKLSQYEIVPAE